MTLTSSMVIAFSRPVFLVRFVIPGAIKTNSTPLIDESPRIPTDCKSALVILFRMTLAGLAALLGLYGRDIHCTGKADDSDKLFFAGSFLRARICSIRSIHNRIHLISR